MNKLINAGVVSLAILLSTSGGVIALMQEWVTIPGNPNTVFEDIPAEGSDLRLSLDAQSGYAIDSSGLALWDDSDTVQWHKTDLLTYDIGTVLSSREWLSVTGTYHKIEGEGGGSGTLPQFNAKVAAPDVDMTSLPENQEEIVGAWLAKDGSRKVVTVLAVKQRGPNSQQTLTWSSGNLSLWTAATGGDMLPGSSKSISAAQGAMYYAQGINANAAVRDSEIVAEYTVNSQVARDRVNLTVVGAEITDIGSIAQGQTNENVSVTLFPSPCGTNITLQLSWDGSGNAVFIPSESTTSNITQSATVKIKGVTASSVASNIMLKAMFGSDVLASNRFTVVGLQSPLQYRIGTNTVADMPDPLYVVKDTTVDFKAIKAPTNCAWPSGKPVWGGLLSGSGMESNSYTFSTVSTSATDYKIVSAECGNIVTGRVIVADVMVTNIKFNHDTGSSSSDALNIRKDYNTSYDISNGEWVKGGTNIPACYTINKAITIKARLITTPAVNVTADIWAESADSGGSLGDVIKTNVSFSGGVSSPEYVTFQISGTTPNCVKKTTTDVWEWKIENVNGSGSSACNLNTSGVHTVYTILNDPATPWSNVYNSSNNTWVLALDFVIGNASCNGDTTASSALTHIAQYLHSNGFGMSYDTANGATHYGMTLGTDGNYDLTSYMNGSGTVNCYDQAAGVTVCSRLLGINSDYLFMDPFGYILATDLVGIGQCNNPFYPGRPPPYNIPLLGTNGVTDLVWSNRSGFGNHAFVRQNSVIYDATCGPHIGTENLVQYATSAIDISALAERSASPDTNADGSFSTTEVDAATTVGNVSNIH